MPYIKGFLPSDGGRSSLHLSVPPSVKQSRGKRNTLIFSAIKKIIEDQPNGKWAEELPRVVWSKNTSVSRATNSMPFKLLYGEELVTPEEITF
jgi:hypothetical protein